MHPLFKTALLGSVLGMRAIGADVVGAPPWKSSELGVETGILWEVAHHTPFPYRMLQTQVSWRSAEFRGFDLEDGSRILVRHRLTLLGAAIQQAPEARYVAFAGSPSIEWWNKAATWSLFTGAGGGFGAIDSRGIKGGQGQDFTLNWFARGGLEHVAGRNFRVSAAIMFQHLSNGGQTNPNPGINLTGFMIGGSWRF